MGECSQARKLFWKSDYWLSVCLSDDGRIDGLILTDWKVSGSDPWLIKLNGRIPSVIEYELLWVNHNTYDVLEGRLTDWLTEYVPDWLASWLTDWLTDWMADWLAGWLQAVRFPWRTDLTDWLTGWLIKDRVKQTNRAHVSRVRTADYRTEWDTV